MIHRLADCTLFPQSGMVFDVKRRAFISRIGLVPLAPFVLARAGDRLVVVQADLAQLVATDLRNAEVLWRVELPSWMSDLAVLSGADGSVITMRAVGKFGPGETYAVDARRGAQVDWRAFGEGAFRGDAQWPEYYTSVVANELRLHRTGDRTVVARHSWSEARAPGQTTVQPDGTTVTEHGLDLNPPERIFFGADGVLLVQPTQVVLMGSDGGSQGRPIEGAVLSAEWHEGGWNGLVRRPDGSVDALRWSSGETETLWANCDGIGIIDGELVTSSMQVGPIRQGRSAVALVVPAESTTARELGPILVSDEVIAWVAKLRNLGMEKKPPGLSLDKLREVESKLATQLPGWVLALLAAASGALSRAWGTTLDKLVEHGEALVQLEGEHLANQTIPGVRTPFPKGLVAIGCATRTEKIKRGAQVYQTTSSSFWCAQRGDCYLIERRGSSSPNDPATAAFAVAVTGPFAPSHVLAPLIESLRAKNTLKLGGAFRVKDQEEQAVRELTELRLV